ncbi:hypothetical protein [Streptomyces rhizosphaericus]|uniref:hypothetical protein n=1 Tax=Streptomyces rhizosphaericus TaxID=114699 RepID=UPI00117C3ADC
MLVDVLAYEEGERAAAVRRAQRACRYERLPQLLLVERRTRNRRLEMRDAGGRRMTASLDSLDPAARKRLFRRTAADPTADNEAFVPFARKLPHPIIGELLAGAEPGSDVVTTRSTANVRRYYEKTAGPEGFAVLGDAVAGYNPVYGHGLSAAAQSVVAVREVVRRRPIGAPGTARRIQRAAARPVDNAWNLAVGQDVFHPGASDQPPTRLEKSLAAFVDRVVDAGARNPRALRILLDVMSMEKPPARLLMPDMPALVCLGRRKPLLPGPPLTDDELKAAGI